MFIRYPGQCRFALNQRPPPIPTSLKRLSNIGDWHSSCLNLCFEPKGLAEMEMGQVLYSFLIRRLGAGYSGAYPYKVLNSRAYEHRLPSKDIASGIKWEGKRLLFEVVKYSSNNANNYKMPWPVGQGISSRGWHRAQTGVQDPVA